MMCSKPAKMTRRMEESLETLRSSLLCPLCNLLMNNVSMLNCGHSFCTECIVTYTSKHWTCPVPGCNFPVSSGRERGTSYLKKNASIEAVILALNVVEQNIARAPDRWWESNLDKKKSAVKFEDDEEIVDFQQSIHENLHKNTESSGSKRKCPNFAENADEASSTTVDFEAAEGSAFKANKIKNTLNLDSSLFDPGECLKLNQSCTMPSLSSQQLSPILPQNSQQSVQPCDISDCRNIPSALQLEMVQGMDVAMMPTRDQRKRTSSSQINGRNAFPRKERKSTQSSLIKKTTPSSPTRKLVSVKSAHSVTTSAQSRPRVILLCPSWDFKPRDAKCIRKCISDGNISVLSQNTANNSLLKILGMNVHLDSYDFDTEYGRESFLSTLSCQRGGDDLPVPLSFFAVSVHRDYAMDEGIVVPRSFEYYLAVACGMPIVDVALLSTISGNNKLESGNQVFPFLNAGKETSDENIIDKKFVVIGATDYSWNAPQKSRDAVLSMHRLWAQAKGPYSKSDRLAPGTDLLSRFDVILLGEYDQPSSNQRAAKKKKETSELITTRGNVTLLLQLCGARVYDVSKVTPLKQLGRIEIENLCKEVSGASIRGVVPTLHTILKAYSDNSSERCIMAMVNGRSSIKFASEFLARYTCPDCTGDNKIPIITPSWLFDSIGNWHVERSSSYVVKSE